MSFNNLKYDTNSYKHVLSESVAPLEYQLGTPLKCSECLVSDPSIKIQGVSVISLKNIEPGDEICFNYNESETSMSCPFETQEGLVCGKIKQ